MIKIFSFNFGADITPGPCHQASGEQFSSAFYNFSTDNLSWIHAHASQAITLCQDKPFAPV